LKADRVQLGYTRIYAPMAGTVLSVDARQGQTINATYETPTLLRIADLSTMTVWTQVSEADVTRLHPGMPLYFTTLGYDDRRWDAKLRQILPAPPRPLAANSRDSTSASATLPAPGNVVLYTALFDVENTANALRPDMTAQVFFIAAEAKNAAIVPVAALTPDNKTPGHYAVNVVAADQALTTRDVMIGIKTRFSAQILSGLVPGDRIVTGKLNGPDTSSSLLGFQP
jgi:macrolide-specific efflux system membrane fusion protein